MEELEKMDSTIAFLEKYEKDKPITGILRYKVYKNGVLQEEREEKNLIVNGAREQMARLVAGDAAGRSITRIAFGEDGTAPRAADATLTNPFTKNISGFSFPQMGSVLFNWDLTVNEANGKAILEFGLVTADETLFSRRVRENGQPIHKDRDISLAGEWEIIF